MNEALNTISHNYTKILEAQTGLRGLGYLMVDAGLDQSRVEEMGYAIAALADHMQNLSNRMDRAVNDLKASMPPDYSEPVTTASTDSPNHVN